MPLHIHHHRTLDLHRAQHRRQMPRYRPQVRIVVEWDVVLVEYTLLLFIIYYFVSYLLSWGSLRHIRQITITFTRARENEMRDIVTSIACRRMPGCHRLYVTMTKCEMRGRHCHGGVLSLSPLPMQILPLILHLILHFILWCSASSSPKNFSDLSLSSPISAIAPCPQVAPNQPYF
jgi:hypothetical protein